MPKKRTHQHLDGESTEVNRRDTGQSLAASRGQGSNFGSLFQNKQFMALWTAQVFSQLADRAVFVLFVALLTARQAQELAPGIVPRFGAAEMTSWLYVAFTIPAIVLSPFAGVCVDRVSNRTVFVASSLVRGIFVTLLSWPLIAKYPLLAYTLAFFMSIGAQFFGPAETAAIPRLVRKQDLYSANSLFFTTLMITLGFGFAVGEPIISHIGIGKAPYFIACCFFLAALLLSWIKDNNPSAREKEPWWDELCFGLNYIFTNPVVFRSILKITTLFSTIITLNIIAVGLTEQVLRIQPFQFGYIVAAAGTGMAIGNFCVAHWGQKVRPNVLAYAGFTGLGLFMALLGSLGFIQDYLWPMVSLAHLNWQGPMMSIPLVLAMFIGASCAMVAVPTQAALQAAVPEELRGKVFGAQNTAMSFASTVPVVLAGLSADHLPGGVSTTLLLIGIPTLLAGIYHVHRTMRRYPRQA